MAKSRTVEVSFFAEMEDGSEKEIFVECANAPGCPAKVDGPWESCYQEEPGELFDIEAFTEDGISYDLREDEHEKIRELVGDKIQNEYYDDQY